VSGGAGIAPRTHGPIGPGKTRSHERQTIPGGNVSCVRNRRNARRRAPAESRKTGSKNPALGSRLIRLGGFFMKFRGRNAHPNRPGGLSHKASLEPRQAWRLAAGRAQRAPPIGRRLTTCPTKQEGFWECERCTLECDAGVPAGVPAPRSSASVLRGYTLFSTRRRISVSGSQAPARHSLVRALWPGARRRKRVHMSVNAARRRCDACGAYATIAFYSAGSRA
jgi:hypothetical protein